MQGSQRGDGRGQGERIKIHKSLLCNDKRISIRNAFYDASSYQTITYGFSCVRPAGGGCDFQPNLIPLRARGLFNVGVMDPYAADWTPQFRVKFTDITDGLSSTFAMGEAAGGNSYYLVADVNNPSQPVLQPSPNGLVPAVMDQGWACASIGDTSTPWYASILGVTAQIGFLPNQVGDLMDEPMNRRPGMPSTSPYSLDFSGARNADGLSRISGFRSMHAGGCNFLYADGSVHFVPQSIDSNIYRALSTYAGGEVVSNMDF
jgi:prepilin-type processing-associated H-X9-DG protein